MRFTIWLEPRPQRRPRASSAGGRGARLYKAAGQAADEGNLVSALLEHRPETPLEGPLSLEFTAAFPYPRSVPLKRRAALRHVTKPDVDNLAKFLMDCLQTAQFFPDDRQVTRIGGGKIYTDGPGRWDVVLTPDGERD
jgi:Holliday junction resolvase RusA-like endonuclease